MKFRKEKNTGPEKNTGKTLRLLTLMCGVLCLAALSLFILKPDLADNSTISSTNKAALDVIPKGVILSLTKSKTAYLNDIAIPQDQLAGRLEEMKRNGDVDFIRLRAESDIDIQEVINTVDLIKKLNIANVTLETENGKDNPSTHALLMNDVVSENTVQNEIPWYERVDFDNQILNDIPKKLTIPKPPKTETLPKEISIIPPVELTVPVSADTAQPDINSMIALNPINTVQPEIKPIAKTGTKEFHPIVNPGIDTKSILSVYENSILAKIDSAKQYPQAARSRGKEGRVRLELTVNPNGSVQGVNVLDGPATLFSNAAIDAVRRAEPFNPIPSSLGMDKVTVSFWVTFRISDIR